MRRTWTTPQNAPAILRFEADVPAGATVEVVARSARVRSPNKSWSDVAVADLNLFRAERVLARCRGLRVTRIVVELSEEPGRPAGKCEQLHPVAGGRAVEALRGGADDSNLEADPDVIGGEGVKMDICLPRGIAIHVWNPGAEMGRFVLDLRGTVLL